MDTCFVEDQDTHPPATSKTKPSTKHLVTMSLAQFESVQPTTPIASLP